MSESEQEEHLPSMPESLSTGNTSHLYANSVAFGQTNADMFLVFQQNGENVAIVNMSYTLMKTVAERLSAMIETLEERTGHEIMTTDFIDRHVKDNESKNG